VQAQPTLPDDDVEYISNEEVSVQLQQFLDEWYFRILSSSAAAKDVNRWEALRLLLDVLEMVGIRFSDGEKEMLVSLNEEEGLVARLVDCMPQSLRGKWDHVMLHLQTVLLCMTRVRKAAEAKGEDADACVSEVFEESGEDGVLQQILKSAVLFSTDKVTRLRRIHSTWRDNTDDRIDRLARLQEDAESASQELLRLESQLQDLGDSQKAAGKSMLLKLASGQDTALTKSVFGAWCGLRSILREDEAIRQKFEGRIAAANRRFFCLQGATTRVRQKCDDARGL
jgi:hypothetical protein